MSEVIVPAGAPIRDAARWVGGACWTELRFHQTLTTWLAIETDDAVAEGLWRVRADRAALAREWHERLPVLRELPRADLVVPSMAEAVDRFSAWDAVVGPGPDATAARVSAAAAVLDSLADGYRSHRSVAVGPADGPVALGLVRAIEATGRDREVIGALRPGADATAEPTPRLL